MEKKNLSKKKYNIIDVYNSPAGSEYYFYDSDDDIYKKVIVKSSNHIKYLSDEDGHSISLRNSSDDINRAFFFYFKEYTLDEITKILLKNPYQKVKVVHPYVDKYLSFNDRYKEYGIFTDIIRNLATELSVSSLATILSEGKWYIEEY